ncbi:MAG: NAD(P)/FAD-dependent oxidoreductase [Parvularculaceae bacterium]
MPDDNRLHIEDSAKLNGGGTYRPRIAILGAGFSGMGMAIRLRQVGFDNFTIYEKAADVGGTWRENIYPGVACDVPSHLYSFSFEPNPHWSRRYSPGAEIWEYMRHCARKYDLYRSIEFDKTVTGIRHDGRQWHVDFTDGSSVSADFVVSGLGSAPHRSRTFLSSRARANFADRSSTRRNGGTTSILRATAVAVIGSAASAIQVIPEIARKVAHLDVYQRTANWVMARQSYAYPRWLQGLFEKFPLLAGSISRLPNGVSRPSKKKTA